VKDVGIYGMIILKRIFKKSGNCSTCIGWYHHPSSGAPTTVSTAFGICHTLTAICRYRGRVGTGIECAVGGVRWVGHVASKGKRRVAYRILAGKPEGKKLRGRRRHIWDDNIKNDFQEMEWSCRLD